MAALLKPKDVQIITKDGECTISIQLELNINLNSDGVTGLSVGAGDSKGESKAQESDDNVDWAIPDFKSPSKSDFKFGKKTD